MIKDKFLFLFVLLLCTSGVPSHSAESTIVFVNPGLYTVKTEILMPHLAENLRYTNTKTQQCLNEQEISSLFPILGHVSFGDCALEKTQAESEFDEFRLVCLNPEAASGTAKFSVSEKTFLAILDIKMGGKNMKFSQRVSGRLLDAC